MFMSPGEVELGGYFVTFICINFLCHKQQSSEQEGSVEIGMHLIECSPVILFLDQHLKFALIFSFILQVSESAD